MKNYKNEKSLFVALLGCTICLMFTLMYLGGFKSLTYFLGSEAIYDFPETDMIKNAKGWEYHEEENGYYIVKNNAVNKYRVDRYVRTWKYLYLTISNCSVSEVHAILEYYDKEKNILKEQPIVIYNGENEIELDLSGLGCEDRGWPFDSHSTLWRCRRSCGRGRPWYPYIGRTSRWPAHIRY